MTVPFCSLWPSIRVYNLRKETKRISTSPKRGRAAKDTNVRSCPVKEACHKNMERGLEGGGKDGTECMWHGEELQQVEEGDQQEWAEGWGPTKTKTCMKVSSEPLLCALIFKTIFTFIDWFFFVCMCTCIHVSWHICGGPSTTWVLKLDLGHYGLVASTLAHWKISPPLKRSF